MEQIILATVVVGLSVLFVIQVVALATDKSITELFSDFF